MNNLLINLKESIPVPPFVSYRVFSDNILRVGIVSDVYWCEHAPSLIGTPRVVYEEGEHPIPQDEKYSVPYLSDISLSKKDAWDRHSRKLKSQIDIRERSIVSAVKTMENTLRKNVREIEELKPSLQIAEKELEKLK
jgi:hypothetical protein